MQKIVCQFCGQDWLRWYRMKGTELAFLLCPECDAVWSPGQDPTRDPSNDLTEVVGNPVFRGTEWDLIEPCDDPPSP